VTKWDYKFVVRFRDYAAMSGSFADWVFYEDGNKLGKADIAQLTKKWGDEGWELVGISARSSLATIGPPGNLTSMGGTTTEELFVFKRPK
jgi:hypothetical protein